MTRWSSFAIAASIIIVMVMVFVLMTREDVVFQYKSPTGQYYILMSRFCNNPYKSVMPGDSGWHQYVYRLYSVSNNVKLATSAPVDMKNVDEAPIWLEDSVCVPHEQYLPYHER